MKYCYFKKIHDILPIATNEVLSNEKTLICRCGCNKAILNGKYYYNKPRPISELLSEIKEMRKLLSI